MRNGLWLPALITALATWGCLPRGPVMSGAMLHGQDLRNKRLAWADLTDADLTDANLAGDDLSGANLELFAEDTAETITSTTAELARRPTLRDHPLASSDLPWPSVERSSARCLRCRTPRRCDTPTFPWSPGPCSSNDRPYAKKGNIL
jgi:hypothetical protein